MLGLGFTMAIDPLAIVAPHCDISDRLAAVPPSAFVRGIWFKTIESELTRLGLLERFAVAFPARGEVTFRMYPLAEYLLRLAYAGALVVSPERLHEGMYQLFRGNATAFFETLLGRSLLRMMAKDPVGVARQAVAAKRIATNYGRWTLVETGPRSFEMVYENEYVWIESALLGGAIGALETTGIKPVTEVRLRDPYNGSLIVRW